jgi:NAD(P)-dependent dehydrogenase (short-subunit alcohol dehydrogenase family)
LARRGAAVVAADLNQEGADQIASSVRAAGGKAESACVDVSRADEVARLVEGTVARHGRLDYMFNNAGIGIWGDVRDIRWEQWHRLMDIDLWGVVYGSLAGYHVMARQRCGHIVNTASLSGLVGVPATIPYTTAKHAVVGFSTALRAEGAGLGIKVTVVCPGPVRSRFHESLLLAGNDPSAKQAPSEAVDADRAARMILRGVARNRRIVVFPLRARITWRLYQFAPALLMRAFQPSVRKCQRGGLVPRS